MIRRFSFLLVSIFSLSAFAITDIDYTRCNSAMGGDLVINNDGNLSPTFGQKIKKKTVTGNIEKYVLEADKTIPGFTPSDADQEIILIKDDKGNL